MTDNDFNTKYKDYLKEGTNGMDTMEVQKIKYLDNEFSKEIELNPLFVYSQIKMKCGTIRIYTNSDNRDYWENDINNVFIKNYD